VITIHTTVTAALLARFVLESELEYPSSYDQDGRLACWLKGEGQWTVAYLGYPARIACLVTLDDGPYAGHLCLFWIEVRPLFRGRGVGRALLHWAEAQIHTCPMLIKSVPEAAAFYRHYLRLPARETEANTFVVNAVSCGRSKGGGAGGARIAP
jgi:GNAT superfamily N-acetyltransferase